MRHPSADKRKAEIQSLELPYEVHYECGISISVHSHNVYPPGSIVKEILHLVETGEIDFKDKDVLDVGCGCGVISVMATKFGANKVVALDIVEDCIKETKANALKNKVEINARLSDGFETVLEPEKFDIIICIAPQDDAIPEDDLDRAFYDPSFALINSLATNSKRHLKKEGIILLAYMDHNAEKRLISEIFSGSQSRLVKRIGADISLFEISYPSTN